MIPFFIHRKEPGGQGRKWNLVGLAPWMELEHRHVGHVVVGMRMAPTDSQEVALSGGVVLLERVWPH